MKQEKKNQKKNQKKQKKQESIMLLGPALPTLRFNPAAWAKLLHFRDKRADEVGGFGVSRADDLLYVEDFVVPKQAVSAVGVLFEDDAVADYFEDQVDAGRKPEQFGRIWLHTHPGDSAGPSGTDEETFKRVFGKCQWALMFILARGGETYARLRFNVGPGGQVLIPVAVDYGSIQYEGQEGWDDEFRENVQTDHYTSYPITQTGQSDGELFGANKVENDFWDDYLGTQDLEDGQYRGLAAAYGCIPDPENCCWCDQNCTDREGVDPNG